VLTGVILLDDESFEGYGDGIVPADQRAGVDLVVPSTTTADVLACTDPFAPGRNDPARVMISVAGPSSLLDGNAST
jgi:hypothetical protein